LLTGNTWTFTVVPSDAGALDASASSDPQWRAAGDSVSAGFFHTVGSPLIAGREFDENDRRGSQPVVVLNETAARFYFPRGNAVGNQVHATGPFDSYQIVGVVKDMRVTDLRQRPPKQIFFCAAQQIMNSAMTLHLHTRSDPVALMAGVRETIHEMAPDTAVFGVKTLEQRRDDSLSRERMLALLGSFFGAAAALIAALGLFGVLADAVSRRTREFGIRRAIGAQTSDIVRQIGWEAARMTGIGFLIGIPLAIAGSRSVGALLFDVQPSDPWTYSMAALGCVAITIIGAAMPGLRAARVEPAVALRDE
jgi:hypothetical protein